MQPKDHRDRPSPAFLPPLKHVKREPKREHRLACTRSPDHYQTARRNALEGIHYLSQTAVQLK